jgi:tRNA threonylcarbamoyladenosine biosynthesis protein TsaE
VPDLLCQIILNHLPILETRWLHWPDEAACAQFAATLAAHSALAQARIELDGPLGAGKTTLVRYLLRALGVSGRIKSPTYAVMEPYQVQAPNGQILEIAHFDFYRFGDPREWEDAGLRDVFAQPGLRLSEWAEKARPMLPSPDLQIHLIPQPDNSRQVQLQACSATGQLLLPPLP